MAQRALDIALLVLGVPQLGHDEELVPRDLTRLDQLLKRCAHFGLVVIAVGTVNVPIASPDGRLDSFTHHAVLGLPRAKSNERHLHAVVQQGDSRRRHARAGRGDAWGAWWPQTWASFWRVRGGAPRTSS